MAYMLAWSYVGPRISIQVVWNQVVVVIIILQIGGCFILGPTVFLGGKIIVDWNDRVQLIFKIAT